MALVVQTRESRADFAQCSNPLTACTSTSSSCCIQSFSPSGGYNPLIITADRCHQPVGTGTLGPPGPGAPRRELAITSIVRSGTTVTVTTSVPHGLVGGAFVKIAGTGLSDLHGTWTIKTAGACTPVACTDSQFQYSTTSSGALSSASGYVLAHNPGQGWCNDYPGSDAARIGGAVDNGVFRSYGLIYRLMQRGIPVYWLVNPSKTAPALTSSENAASQSFLATDVDFWVVTSDVTDPPAASVGLTSCGVGCTQPVHRLRASSLAPRTDSYRYKELPVRGGAFLIAAANRAAFNDFWLRQGDYASLAGDPKYNWQGSGIDLYELDATAKIVYQNFALGDGTTGSPHPTTTGAPVAVKIDYEPPRIACIGCGDAVAQGWLDTAGLRDPATPESCLTGEFVPADATYCVINDYDVAQGALVNGGFSWAWVLGYNDNSPCGNSAEKAMFDKLRDFMTTVPAVRNAGHAIILDASIKVAEGCPGKQLMGFTQTTTDGLDLNPIGGAEPYILRYPNNLFMQFGDIPVGFASGTMGSGWKYYKSGTPTIGYQTPFQNTSGLSTLRRLVSVDTTGTNNTACVQHTATASCDAFTPLASTGDTQDMAAYARFDNDLNNGLMYYLPGRQLDNSGNSAELRMLLNSLLAIPDESFNVTPTIIEVARSSPIVATVDAEELVFQGTYERADPIPAIPKATTSASLVRFTFPYLKGHFRAIPVASFGACSGANCATDNTSRTEIGALSGVLYDATTLIPNANPAGCGASAFSGNCRTVFTNLSSGRLPNRIDFSTANLNAQASATSPTFGTLLASNLTTSERQTLISRILAGVQVAPGVYGSRLGGIDRSTPAVIGPSPLAGSLGRPTMAYFGATDGMLHAVCVTTGTMGCNQQGRELWAFIPRTVLPDLRVSTARVDGSPHVVDVYGDFDNDGIKAFHTILIFHTGTGRMTNDNVVPAVYALDITTPNSPKILWEYAVTDVGNRASYDMGVGLNISAGQVTIAGVTRTVAYVQTNNGGIAGAASVITAIDAETGSELWQFGDLYPTNNGASARNANHEAAPASGIPGGAVGIDRNGNGKITHVVYGTLYGDVYVREADTGANQNGTGPLLRITADYKPIGVPPAIYVRGTKQYAAFTTGGYADSQATLWRGENEATLPTQFFFSVDTTYSGGTTNENDSTNVPIKFDFGAGEGGFAQAIVVGGQLFVTTDSTNINSYDFGTSSAPTGKVYTYDFAATAPSQGNTLVVASGAGSLFNSGAKLLSASGRYGERLTEDALSTVGTSIDPTSSSKTSLVRKLWLRTE